VGVGSGVDCVVGAPGGRWLDCAGRPVRLARGVYPAVCGGPVYGGAVGGPPRFDGAAGSPSWPGGGADRGPRYGVEAHDPGLSARGPGRGLRRWVPRVLANTRVDVRVSGAVVAGT